MYNIPLKLEVVPSEEKRARLDELFKSPEGVGNNSSYLLMIIIIIRYIFNYCYMKGYVDRVDWK